MLKHRDAKVLLTNAGVFASLGVDIVIVVVAAVAAVVVVIATVVVVVAIVEGIVAHSAVFAHVFDDSGCCCSLICAV